MIDFVSRLFDTTDFPARWQCGNWTSGHGWLHVISDLATFGAYMTIPFVLVYFLRKRPDMPFPRIFYLFAAFIFACGTVHLIEAGIFWWPAYRLSGVFKLLTAVVSWGTVIAVIAAAPRAIRMRSAEELEREIRQREQAQEQLLQAERLSGIGQAMTGLVHESRNALARSQAGLKLLSRQIGDRPELFRYIDEALRAQRDVQRLFEEVRQYAVPPKPDRQNVDLVDVIEDVWGNLSEQYSKRDVELLHDKARINTKCEVDPLLIGNVFRNLFENSLSACTDPVEIRVRYQSTEHKEVPTLEITIRDNGPGLNEEQQAHIFDAFYTTKTQGAGLGMAIVKRTLESHHGTISLGTAENGAYFVISLPRRVS